MPVIAISITDKIVGERLRERRIHLGISQTQLGGLMGCSYQQVGKYENGINRVSLDRLLSLAPRLGVDLGYFYNAPELSVEPPTHERSRLEAARLFAQCSEKHQRVVLDLLRALVAP